MSVIDACFALQNFATFDNSAKHATIDVHGCVYTRVPYSKVATYTYGVDFRLLFLELGNAKALKRRQQENVCAFSICVLTIYPLY